MTMMNMINSLNFTQPHASEIDYSFVLAALKELEAKLSNVSCVKHEDTFDITMPDIYKKFSTELPSVNHKMTFLMPHDDTIFINVSGSKNPAFVWFYKRNNFKYAFMVFGEINFATILMQNIMSILQVDKTSVIEWAYTSSHGISTETILLETPPPIDNDIYPYFDMGLEDIYEDYRKSKEPIMVLLGPPGTGKTTFVRNFIHRYNLSTLLTFDENVYKSDKFFIQYLTDEDQELLIIEDADLLLTSREQDGNKLMSKFLNITDGLISMKHKKVIFTANITNVSKIDAALIRPGRCYGVLNFRPLKYTEALKVTEKHGIVLPEDDKVEYTVADIFNIKKKINKETEFKKFGFI